MTSRRLWTMVACGLTAAAMSGCGGGSNAALSTQASGALSQQVDAVRSAVVNHDVVTADSRLSQLRTMVAALQAQGQISSSRSAQILAAASDVGVQLQALTTTTTSPRPTPTTAAAVSTGGGPVDHGKGKKKK